MSTSSSATTVGSELTIVYRFARWLERTFKRHSATLKPKLETSSARSTRKPVHGAVLVNQVPRRMPTSASMPQLSISAANFNANSPSRSTDYGPRTPTTLGPGFNSKILRPSVLRNVSAASTYQLGALGSGSGGTPKDSGSAQKYSDASSPLLVKRARDFSSFTSTHAVLPLKSQAKATEVEIAAQMDYISLTSPVMMHK